MHLSGLGFPGVGSRRPLTNHRQVMCSPRQSALESQGVSALRLSATTSFAREFKYARSFSLAFCPAVRNSLSLFARAFNQWAPRTNPMLSDLRWTAVNIRAAASAHSVPPPVVGQIHEKELAAGRLKCAQLIFKIGRHLVRRPSLDPIRTDLVTRGIRRNLQCLERRSAEWRHTLGGEYPDLDHANFMSTRLEDSAGNSPAPALGRGK